MASEDLKAQIQQALRKGRSDDLKQQIKSQLGSGKPEHKPSSLFGQVGHLVTGLPAGLGGMAVSAVKDANNVVEDLAFHPRRLFATGDEGAKRYPFTSGMVGSARRTGGRVTQGAASLAPGGLKPSETEYGRAIREGTIVPTIVEDAANAAIVGGLVTRGVGAVADQAAARAAAAETVAQEAGSASARAAAQAAAERAARWQSRATTAERVVHGADRVAAAPARVWTAPFTGVTLPRVFGEGARIPGLVEAAQRSGVGPRIAASNVGQSVPGFLAEHGFDKATREERARLRDEYIIPAVQERQLVGRQHELAVKQAERYLSDRDAQHANHLVHTGQEPLVRTALSLTGDQQTQFIRDTWGVEQAPSIKTLQMAAAYVEGRLPQASREAMDAAWSVTRRMSDAHERAALAGEGRVGGPLSPEQVEYDVMPSAVEAITRPRRQAIEQIQKELVGEADDPGLYAQARAARARVPEVNLAEQVSERAVRRVEKAGGLEERAVRSRAEAERLRAEAAAAGDDVARMTERGLPGPERDLGAVTAPVERGAVRAERAAGRAARAEGAGQASRGRIFGSASRTAAREVMADGGLFSPENRARVRPEDVTAETVRPQLERLDGDLRGVAADAASLAREELRSTFDTERLAYKPKQRPMTAAERRMAGIVDNALAHIDDTGGEWDWFRALAADEQARIRKNWMAREGEQGGLNPRDFGERGVTPDRLQAAMARGDVGLNLTIEQAAAEFVRRTAEIEALERIAAGKGIPGDVDLVGYLIDQAAQRKGIRLDMEDVRGSLVDWERGRAGKGPKQRMAQRADAFAEHLRQRLSREELPPEPPIRGTGRLAWEMPVEEFTAEVMDLSQQLADIVAAATDDFIQSPQEAALIRRLAELVPREFEIDGDLAATHRAIVEAAVAHDYPVPEGLRPSPAEAVTPETAGATAVRDAVTVALDALERDMQTREAFRRDKAKVPTETLEYTYLTPGQRTIYREAQARAKKIGAEQALAEARQRVASRLEASGERFGRRVGQAEGAARVFGREAGRLERTAATAERRLAPKVTESIGELTPEERATVEPTLPPGEELLGRYERTETPGAKEAARADLERSMARPVRAGERRGIAEEKARQLERTVRSKERRLAWLETKLDEQERMLAEGPLLKGRDQVVPGFARVPLLNARNAKISLQQMADALEEETGDHFAAALLRDEADGLPSTLDDLKRAGIQPEYLIGGYEERPGGAVRTPGRREKLPFKGRLDSERMKKEGTLPKTTRAAGRRYVEEASRIIENKTADRIASEVARDARTLLEEVLPDEALREKLTERGGHDLVMHLEREGFVPWDPRNPTGTIGERQVTADTLFLPKPLFAEFRTWFKPAKKHWALTVLDAPVRGWKHMVLAMSPSWHIGNVVGNVMLATVGGGLSPVEVARYGAETLRLLREERRTGQVHFPPRLYGAGMGGEMLRFFADKEGEGRGIFGRHPIQASYNLNAFVDDWGRSTVYLAKKAKGLSTEEAVAEALKAMGDFGKMTPFEKEFVRRAFPFYAWTRHVTQLSYHLALEHPFRVAWTLHLAELYRPTQEENLPEFLQGAIKIGDNRYISLGLLNPYETFASNPLDPANLGRGLNPLAKTAVGYTWGINLNKNREYRRAPGTEPVDFFGNRTFGSLSPKQLVYVLSQQTPLTRAAYSAASKPVLRYDTGDPMRVAGQDIPSSDNRATTVARNFVPFLPMTFDPESTDARRFKKLEEQRKARQRYFGG